MGAIGCGQAGVKKKKKKRGRASLHITKWGGRANELGVLMGWLHEELMMKWGEMLFPAGLWSAPVLAFTHFFTSLRHSGRRLWRGRRCCCQALWGGGGGGYFLQTSTEGENLLGRGNCITDEITFSKIGLFWQKKHKYITEQFNRVQKHLFLELTTPSYIGGY